MRHALRVVAAITLAAAGASAQPSVYWSPADDGAPADPGFSLEPGVHLLPLYFDGESEVGSADPCADSPENQGGDDVCGWQMELRTNGGVDFVLFDVVGDEAVALQTERLRVVGGDAIAGDLGPTKIGDLTIHGTGAGSVDLVAGQYLDAFLGLQPSSPATLVTVPEPDAAAVAVAAIAALLARARRRRALLAALALSLAVAGSAHAADVDADGVEDAVDVCPTRFDPGQADVGGLDTSTPDGVGDACQCGDVDGDGVVNLVDAAKLQRSVGALETLAAPAKCPGAACDAESLASLRQALADEAPPATCAAASELACSDGYEANDARATHRFLGDFPDDGDGSTLVATLPPGDQDWFSFDLIDESSGDFQPFAVISTASADYDVCFYVDCDNGSTAQFECAAGTPSLVDGIPGCCNTSAVGGSQSVEIDSVSCGGAFMSEDSRIFVRVFRASSVPAACGPYTLQFGG